MAEKIEIVGKGTDLKLPGSHAVLVDCVGQHAQDKNGNGYRQDQDAQSLHRLTRSNRLTLYVMKPAILSNALKVHEMNDPAGACKRKAGPLDPAFMFLSS
jgi:hypothetical protein